MTLKLMLARAAACSLFVSVATAPLVVFAQQPAAPAPAQQPAAPAQQRPAAPRAAQPAPAQPAQSQRPAAPPAQEQQATVTPRQITGTTTGWVKVCQKIDGASDKEGCVVSQEVRADNGAFLASIALQEVVGEPRRQLILAVPLGMALQAGLLVRVDQERAVPAKFGTCLQNGCFAGIDVGSDLLAAMNKGQNLLVTVRNAQGIALDLTVPLANFVKVHQGPATDLKVVEEQQRQLEKELEKRALEARQKLLEQQGQANPAPGAAPAPAAKP
ncbi:MAG: invasion associated locus B family protein [Hyphomicrobiales bacterium]|nr:invasion associated locus B family protein [Hyphomicrobiales bacterium]OQW83174.1 MAG: hypothetical protein BVN31_06500 [Proteobacteria bacterium ST_bin15]